VGLLSALGAAAALRLVDLNALGYNSDEAVYAGQAASLAGNPHYTAQFPVFRAHPLLIQSLLSLVYRQGQDDLPGRLVEAGIGVATVLAVFFLGRELYGNKAGIVAAWILAVMPYHVIVSRQVLLDGPMVFLTTCTLLLIARYATTQRIVWFLAASGFMGLSLLAKETSIVLLASIYAFFALTPHLKRKLSAVFLGLIVMAVVVAAYPISVATSGHGPVEKSYLVWQLFRPANHAWSFYATALPPAIGWGVIAAALLSFTLLHKRASWRETLLASWIVVPVVAFELWPVKGYQYLVMIAPPFAVLAARTIVGLTIPRLRTWAVNSVRAVVAIAIVVSLALPSWRDVTATNSTTFLAGTGGVPGGREAGRWVDANIPKGATLMTLGPSMANILEFYGHRTAYGLSVSTNPLHRNPSYKPIANPDYAVRSVDIQYVVWDAYSAGRSPFFAQHELDLVRRYHGHVVHTQSVPTLSADGVVTSVPVIIIYEVSPWSG
jgi:4-amino-4-deoxy-L-arabinose transferase-like glycosyltransferase